MNKNEITYFVVEHLAVLSAKPSGYTKELKLVAWNGHDEKLDQELQDTDDHIRDRDTYPGEVDFTE